jgi:hypothetical protein
MHSKINKGVLKGLLFYVNYTRSIHNIRCVPLPLIYPIPPMITSETPHKLAEIIRDTWPGLYRKPEPSYNNQKTLKNEKV